MVPYKEKTMPAVIKIKTRKKKLSNDVEFHPKHRETILLRHVMENKLSGYYRMANFANELVFEDKTFRFQGEKLDKAAMKGMFLFGMVSKDARLYCQGKTSIRLPKKYPVNEYNYEYKYFKQPVTATDLNHAYWRIAYNLGIIQERTYIHGLKDDFKRIRLAALSSLGAAKDYQLIKDGIITPEVIKVGGDAMLADCYRKIRYECYRMMQECKIMLGDNFLAYRTDCIYYKDSKAIRKQVADFFDKENMPHKQLEKTKAPPAQA